jgi:BirA family biotin operon repressor/biotin-[acetyl-CoA-carboxylase] ligase
MEILSRLLREFEADYNRFLQDGPASVIQRFSAISSFASGKNVRVTSGTNSFLGVTEGLSEEGLLMVRRDNGQTVTVIAGDVAEAR